MSGHATGAGRRVPYRDRAWTAVRMVRLLGPLHGLCPAELRTALIRRQAADPGWPPLSRLVDGRRWVPRTGPDVAAQVAALVSTPGPAGDPAGQALAVVLAADVRETPLRLAVCGGYLAAAVNHCVADARGFNALLGALAADATGDATGDDDPDPSAAPIGAPLARAVLGHFGRHPRSVPAALRLARPPVPELRLPAGWRPEPTHRSVRSARLLPALREWRATTAPAVSTASALFAAVLRAFAAAGLPARGPGVTVLVDARRYLPASRPVAGNFAFGQYLRPEPLDDPVAIDGAVRAELAAGRALSMMVARTAHVMLAPHSARGAHRWAGAPTMTLTHFGRCEPLAPLPWAAAPPDRRNVTVLSPAGPDAITVSVAELSGVLHLDASFHATSFAAGQVRRALDLVCERPADLLSG
ncbi:hypothetical protein Athai_48970 [Actinocatenispora thailandica]|uniref:Condensation domain-containing protein n=1 Tax=Actinocatenispora thailandica TaxID=227318 RepID=A0A7R7DT75_9ACTN|nr:hypothetical protein [Actinocatenispora thailandica]BCJ37394.1 hypothetical protein Athai_48970 [Actinocatenispora thailandica]